MSEEVYQILGKCTAEIEQHLHAMSLPQNSPHGLAIVGLLDVLVSARTARDNVAVVRVVHKVNQNCNVKLVLRLISTRYFYSCFLPSIFFVSWDTNQNRFG